MRYRSLLKGKECSAWGIFRGDNQMTFLKEGVLPIFSSREKCIENVKTWRAAFPEEKITFGKIKVERI